MKYPKFFHRIGSFFCGTYRTLQEKKKNSDPEIEKYVRNKRRWKNLPDGYTDTKWIRKIYDKSWKTRVKKEHQWQAHKKTPEERKNMNDYSSIIQDLIYRYGDGEWHEVTDVNRFEFERYIMTIMEREGIAEFEYGEKEETHYLYKGGQRTCRYRILARFRIKVENIEQIKRYKIVSVPWNKENEEKIRDFVCSDVAYK